MPDNGPGQPGRYTRVKQVGIAYAAALGRRERWLVHGSRRQLALFAFSLACLALMLAGGLVRPLSLWRVPGVVPDDRPLATVLGATQGGAFRFGLGVTAVFAAFVVCIWAARGLAGRLPFAVTLGGTMLLSVVMLPTNPVGAQDIYHNAADARILYVYGQNPNVVPPAAFPYDPITEHVPAWADFPSVYGPVWYIVSGAALPFAGDDLWANVIGQKAVTALFLFGATALTMLIAGRIRPVAAVSAGVLVGWNPLLLFETAGNGHNDVVMLFFALAAVYAVTRRWWLAVFPLLALAVATKYVMLLLGPILLLWMLKRQDIPRRSIVWSLGLGAVVGLAVYAPFFAGTDTLAAFQRQTSFNTSSPSALFQTLLMEYLRLGDQDALRATKLFVAPIFFTAYALLLWRIPREAGLVTLARTTFWAVFLLFVIATWWFWPWYLVFLVPFAAILPDSRPAVIATVFSVTSMLMYIPYFWLLDSDYITHHVATAGVAFLPPVLLALIPRLPMPLRRRPAPVTALAGD